MRARSPASQRRRSGFTLLEIVMAMFVFALLVTAVFTVANGTTQLASEMERSTDRELQSFSFAHFCERTFRSLSSLSQVRLQTAKADRQYTSKLTIFNAPPVLSGEGSNGLTILETAQNADGNLRVVLRLVAAKDVTAYETGKGDLGIKLTLVDNVARFEWKFFNTATNQWEPVWNNTVTFSSPSTINGGGSDASNLVPTPTTPTPTTPQQGINPTVPGATPPNFPQPIAALQNGLRPSLIELTMAISGESPRRFVFWAPPASIPNGSAMTPIPPAQPAGPNGVPAVTN